MATDTSTARTPSRTAPASGTLRALQVLAVLTLLSLAFQYVTAGQLFPQGGPEEVHAGGAVALHVLSGLTAIAAFLHRRRAGTALWPVVLAAVVFVLTFVQAATGGRDTLWVHVPGALVLTVGAVWVAAWSFTAGARGALAR
jgi:hypothetical protein